MQKIKKNQVFEMEAGNVAVNLLELQKAAAVAVRNARGECEKYLNKTYARPSEFNGQDQREKTYHANHHMTFNAGLLAKAAADLAQACEVYHAITEAVNGRALTFEIPE